MILAHVLAELDVTPRWYDPHTSFFDDSADILRALGASEAPATRRLLQDVQIGASGVRIVVAVPGGNSTDALDAERVTIKTLLDALDGAHPRRARVTAARAAEALAKLAAQEAMVAEAVRASEQAERAAIAETAVPPPPIPDAESSPDAPPQARYRTHRHAR